MPKQIGTFCHFRHRRMHASLQLQLLAMIWFLLVGSAVVLLGVLWQLWQKPAVQACQASA
jgi:hypothetical protein